MNDPLGAAELLRRTRQTGLVQIAESDTRAGPMERLRDTETDAGARTRDEDRVVFEVEHEVLSVHDEHGLAGEPAGHQILRDLPDLFPRPFQADVG